ncbi:hypothetical protein ACJ73_01906 [Blastomyces percursus]|uniref:ABC transporter domain-containing protein n=1 Tax=Blastomyces percursus TaxID=1658174 RepID=A0A1J9QF11_9EURO|nr:hypothetical protein ACJ73_01906 [Blastomyces percursus]
MEYILAFLSLFLYRYARLVVNLWAYHRHKPITPSRASKLTSKDVTVVIPSVDGHGVRLIHTLQSILQNSPQKVILVTIKKNHMKAEEMIKSLQSLQAIVKVITVHKPNKREQMAAGIREVATKITVFADDDDVMWTDSLLQWILSPFEKTTRTGAVGTCQRVQRNPVQSISQSVFRFLGALYIERRNFDCAATVHIDGGVPCISGRTAAYRTSILQDQNFIQGFCNETWGGNELDPDDDNFLTRWMVSQGWDIHIQCHPDALVSTMLEDNPNFLKQCLRWARSNWRSNLRSMFVEMFIWRRHPYSTYAVYLTTLSPPALVGDAALIWLCNKATEDLMLHHWLLGLLVVWMFISKFIKFLGYFQRHPSDIILLPISILFGYVHGVIKLYAACTLHVTRWENRERPDGTGKEESPRNQANKKHLVCNWKKYTHFLWTVAWPAGNIRLQLHCFGLGMLNRMNELGVLSYRDICIFVLLQVLDMGSLTAAIRIFLLLPLEDYWIKKLKIGSFERIMALSGDFHENNDPNASADLISEAGSFEYQMAAIFLQLGPLLLDALLALSTLYYLETRAAFCFIVVVVFYFCVQNLGPQEDLQRQRFHSLKREKSVVCQSVLNWATVSYFNGFKREKEGLVEAVDTQLDYKKKSAIRSMFKTTMETSGFAAGFVGACLATARGVTQGDRPVGGLFAMLTYWTRLSEPLKFTVRQIGTLREQAVKMEPFIEIFEKTPTVVDPEEDAPSATINSGNIDFDRVNFSYDGRRPIFEDFSFKIKSGQTIVIVGATGSGKSTLIKLLLRQYSPQSGTIRIDGKDISRVRMETVRENIALAPQHPGFFVNTITDNIRYANPKASDADVHEACRVAAIHDQILKYPDRYDTVMRADKLSGGERRRLAIARAFIKNAPLLILDEPTNDLDNKTAAQIRHNMLRRTRGQTTIVISHDINLMKDADKIIVIDSGKVVEEGNHRTLMHRQGHYYKLYTGKM